jgi:hypothetical protein
MKPLNQKKWAKAVAESFERSMRQTIDAHKWSTKMEIHRAMSGKPETKLPGSK